MSDTKNNSPQTTVPNEDPSHHSSSKKMKMGILAYTQSTINSTYKLLESVDLLSSYEVFTRELANVTQIECDIAIVAFSKAQGTIDDFASDCASLKLVHRVPIVLALVAPSRKEEVQHHRDKFAVDSIVYIPIPPEKLQKIIRDHTVALQLKPPKRRVGSALRQTPKQLGQLLVENDIISPMQLKTALEHQKKTDMRLGEALVDLGYIENEQKNYYLASQLGVDTATPSQYSSANTDVVALVPEVIARNYGCVALEKKDNTLVVAMQDVMNLELLDRLRDVTEMTIKPVLGNKEDIEASIERYYREIASQHDASQLTADLTDDIEYVQKEEEEVDLEKMEASGSEMGIIKLVNMLLSNAVKERASDIHIEPQEKKLVIRYRIDGELRKVMSPPLKSHQAIITRIKILSDLDIAERRLPQDGRMVVKLKNREIDVRVSILPSVFGEKAVLRILDKEAFDIGVQNLGFSERSMQLFNENITKPYGMIIVTGPTGSGKSTTLYSAIQSIRDETKNIITTEDPVEFHMNGITQVQILPKIGLTFAAALRSILRQDPDVVLIGEIRDSETADIAIKMALTGHLVFSTLHTNDACSTIARLVDIGVPPLLLGSSLNLVIAQRLVRTICSHCKTEYEPEQELLDQLNFHPEPGTKFYKGEGCVNCNGTGYRGRTALFEMLDVSKSIKRMIIQNTSSVQIQEQAEKEGMRTLRGAGIRKVLEGETTIEQVIAVTTEI
jgi:type IV pilus assembly protein PilB